MLKKCIVPRLATALSLTAAFAVVTMLASTRPHHPALHASPDAAG